MLLHLPQIHSVKERIILCDQNCDRHYSYHPDNFHHHQHDNHHHHHHVHDHDHDHHHHHHHDGTVVISVRQ